MAVLALGFVGSAIGGSIGGSILGIGAATIGGYIGSTVGGLIDNMLFAGSTKVEGPRLDDKRVTVSSYGQTIPKVYGPENRISGVVIWSTGLLETVKKTKQGGKGGPSVTTTEYSYRVSLALLLAAGPCSGVAKIWANSKLIYDRDGTGSPPVTEVLFSALRFYPGDGAQAPDPLIESYVGVGQTPAYRHSCYIVLEDLQLADFGNRLPNIEVLLEGDDSTLTDVVRDVAIRCGATANELSTVGLPAESVRGYVIGGSSRGADALQPLALAYGFDVTEQGGNLRFVPRGSMPKGVIPTDDMGAFEGDAESLPEPIRVELLPPTGLPNEVVITHADPARDYQRNSQPSRRQFGDADSALSYDLPLVLAPSAAARIADRALFEAWVARRVASFATTSRWRSARPGEVYFVETAVGLLRLRLTRALRGANGLIQFEGRAEDPTIYQSTALGISALVPEQSIRPVGETVLVLMDTPLLQDADDDTGFYFAVAGLGSGWRGADVLRSSDGGATFAEVEAVGVSATTGAVAAALPDGPTTVWDTANTLTVVLDSAAFELESASELAVLNGANAFWLGDPDDPTNGEVLQFTTATLTAPGIYTLSGLLRGRANTEYATGLHGPGETFVLLEPGSLLRADFGPGDWNKARQFKAVSLLTDPTTVAAQAFTNTGESKRPPAPTLLRGDRDGSFNLSISWVRRSRLRSPGLGNGDVPLGESTELYNVDIYDGATIVRTIITTEPEAEYTAAEQTSDGLTPGDPVAVRVYQVSDVRGRGRPAIGEV